MPLDFFTKTPLPEELPEEMNLIIEGLKKSVSKEECLNEVYELLSKKYRGYRIKTYARIEEVFKKDLNFLWERTGFLHCNNINYLVRIFLVKSGIFKEEDIMLQWTLVWYISPHQYLRIKISENEFINVDIWGKHYGVEFGDYARGFK